MGHDITALIGQRRSLERLAEQFGPPASTELAYNLVIMPLGRLRLDLLKERPATVYEGFGYLCSGVEAGVIAGVGTEPVLYIETHYFGGTGYQGAALFKDGELLWRDATSISRRSDIGLQLSPISRGLAELGVARTPGADEFDSVGLQRFRSNEALGLSEWNCED
jgi:hypothetical protein